MSTYFIGTIFQSAENWQSIAKLPAAPSNYKDPKKITEYVNKMRESQQFEVATRPVTGAISSICVLDSNCVVTYRSQPGDKQVGIAFIAWLLQKFPNHFGDALRDAGTYPSDIFVGFGIKAALKVAAFEVLQYNKQLVPEARLRVPVRLWHNAPAVYDLEDVLLPAKDAKVLHLYTLAAQLGVGITDDFSTSAQANADVCVALARAVQLMPLSGSGVAV